jgi:hypothetical protein
VIVVNGLAAALLLAFYIAIARRLSENRSGGGFICRTILVVLSPFTSLIGGSKQNAAELARRKGEMDAIEQASIRKKCGIRFRAAPSD